MTMLEELKKEVESLTLQLVRWRRSLHRRPEVAFKEHETSAFLRGHFQRLGIPAKPLAETGFRAELVGRPGGKTVALRSDMDALPLQEEGEKEYISLNPGATHACAHDGHMAVLLGVAELLLKRREQFQGRVVFLFQPAEELPPGGAKPMIKEGAVDGVDAIFGLHLWQGLPTGAIGIVKGPMMAQSDNFKITVRGKGGHGSMPHHAVDPILIASHLVVGLQSIVSRNVDPLKPAVLSFGTVNGGSVYNIIPGEVYLTGTVRTFDPSLQGLIVRRMKEMTNGTALSFGAEATFEYEIGYPPLVNDPASVDFVLDVVKMTLGEERIKPFGPVMGGEDFAYYLQKIPGAFLFFGAGDGAKFPHHHPGFDFDEKALPEATLLMVMLALEFLKGKN
jgi:amidohydrolase